MTLLYDRWGKPFGTTGAVQASLRDLMAQPKVKAVITDLVAAEAIPEGTSFVFHGLRKNACCYLLELGLTDNEVESMLGMSPKMIRHYGKKARVLMITRGTARRIAGGQILALPTKAGCTKGR